MESEATNVKNVIVALSEIIAIFLDVFDITMQVLFEMLDPKSVIMGQIEHMN